MMKSKDLLKKISVQHLTLNPTVSLSTSQNGIKYLEQVNNAFEENHYTEYSPSLCLLTEYSP